LHFYREKGSFRLRYAQIRKDITGVSRRQLIKCTDLITFGIDQVRKERSTHPQAPKLGESGVSDLREMDELAACIRTPAASRWLVIASSQLNATQIAKKGQRPRVRAYLSRAALMPSGWLAESCDDRLDFGMATLTVGCNEAAVGCSIFAKPKGAGTVGQAISWAAQQRIRLVRSGLVVVTGGGFDLRHSEEEWS